MKFFTLLLFICAISASGQELYTFPENIKTAWTNFENPKALKGKAAHENKGGKGHFYEILDSAESIVLFDMQGPAIINRIWITVNRRAPDQLRSIRLDMYWEGSTKPAVSAPLGDFFGIGLGRTTSFQNAFFSNPEGRSFNCYIPMPFKKAAKIIITNESSTQQTLAYEINFSRVNTLPTPLLYFHAYWNSNVNSKLGEDFEILPKVRGKGRFLGCNMGIIVDSVYGRTWWGEGEVKIYLDGDNNLPTLAGTGTEDYIGTGWGQGAYAHQFQGSPIADTVKKQWAFYRYHIPDPVLFTTDCRVTIQQMGGDSYQAVKQIVQQGARLIPVAVATKSGYIKLLEMNPVPQLGAADFPDGWTNFYRLDNYSATSYFYLNTPVNNLPPLLPLKERLRGIARR